MRKPYATRGIDPKQVRRCAVCREPIGHFEPNPDGIPGTVQLVEYPNIGRSKSDYRCVEHEVDPS